MTLPSPLQVNPTTGEPYIRLPTPHTNLIVTPRRESDTDAVVEYLNDPRVYLQLSGPPFPYLPEHFHAFHAEQQEEADRTMADLKDGKFSGCPVSSIREVQNDGSDVLIGDCAIIRYSFWGKDGEEKARLIAANNALPTEEAIWSVGDYLAPSHHGRGIMSLVFKTLLHEWAVPKMQVTKFRVTTFVGNPASARVFEKVGFIETETLVDAVVTARGEIKSINVLDWDAKAK